MLKSAEQIDLVARREEHSTTARYTEGIHFVTIVGTPGVGQAVGIDLGATDLWVVGLDSGELPHIVFAEHLRGELFVDLANLLRGASTVAIDAPGDLSTGCHDGDERLARKFQRARCSEVALRRCGIAVPFATPTKSEPLPAWMAIGFLTWRAAQAAVPTVVETYPHGIFWRLAGRQLTGKQRDEGRAARRAVLAPLVELPPGIDFWPHDALDALACALLAWMVQRGQAEEISCADDLSWAAHDGSSMWLPRS
jgi:predicted nuclease with RNAse H fold